MAYVQMSRYPKFRGFIQKIKLPDETVKGVGYLWTEWEGGRQPPFWS